MIGKGLPYYVGLFTTIHAVTASELFHNLSFEAACQKAAHEQKLVFIDFYTTWCGPCKMLDQTTWKDPSVIRLLREKTFALKIDAEKEVALAKRYGIEAYPTLLLLDPDGKERDRMVGYREAKPFIQDFNSALAGKNAEMRAREAVVKEGEKSPTVRTKLARELENQGKYAEAMEEYLWCFDEGLKHDPAFAGVRLSFLLRDLARLGQRYAPAKKALESRRDSRENELLGGNDNRAGVNELVRLNEYLGQQEKNLALLDRLEKNHPARAFLIPSVSNQLLEKKRYEDLLSAANPDEAFGRALANHEQISKQSSKMPGMSEQLQRIGRQQVITTGATYFEALAGAGKTEEAKAMAQKILKFDSTPETKQRLAGSAERAGNPEVKSHLAGQP